MTSQANLLERLGGSRVLKTAPRSSAEWHALIDEGVPFHALEAVKNALALTDSEIARLVGVSTKTFTRLRAKQGRLDPVASDRLYRVARILTLAIDVLESKPSALTWLKRAQVGLGGLVPLEMLRSDAGTSEVERLLLRIEHGVYT